MMPYYFKCKTFALIIKIEKLQILTLQTLMQFNFNKFLIFVEAMENQKQDLEWFESWFNTIYYHILYQNRNEKEAELFVQNLVSKLKIQASNNVLDLACGKGRHSIILNKLGLYVTGVYLSSNSIAKAKKYENEKLKFFVQDMREPIPDAKFDFIVNLFTSFGYFDHHQDNLKVLKAIHQMLVPGGKLIIDFFNLQRVIKEMKAQEMKSIEGIDFHISKRFDGHHIYKTIEFEAEGKEHSYTEKVQGLSETDFRSLLIQADFELVDIFGDFDLNSFDSENSDRIILVAKKKA
jgi:SAM-dependent methyltransferase